MTAPPPTLRLPATIGRVDFLRDIWQRRPLLIRAALPADCFPLQPDELAGLACEPEFESRLILQHGDSDWQVRHGPFRDEDFVTLPANRWTLLVQDVDKFVPEVAVLRDAFDFVPQWRIDDIMVSYASDQGGVGPHCDAYDVFLMQGLGRRRWRISRTAYTDQDLIPGLEQRILRHFETAEEWLLEPGDVLYLPPGVALWGIAEGPCMTYSLGFRAPSQQEIAADWFQHLVDLAGTDPLSDPIDLQIDSLAELTTGVADRARDLLAGLPTTASDEFRRWLGCALTEPKPQFQIAPREPPWRGADLEAWIHAGRPLTRHPFARLAWTRLGAEAVLFCQGQSLAVDAACSDTVRYIAEHRRLDSTRLGPQLRRLEAAGLILQLINAGVLEPRP